MDCDEVLMVQVAMQEMYQTEKDIDLLMWRMVDDPAGPMTEDEIMNTLQGILELHRARCNKLNAKLNIGTIMTEMVRLSQTKKT
tara:strand:- start:599 stop:850 length:252 start_codon:yes stop_codon:yes gene_type:complete